MDPLRMCELQSVASGLSLSCDAPGAQSAGSIAHGSTPGARRATVLFLDSGFGVAVRTSENKATSAATGVPHEAHTVLHAHARIEGRRAHLPQPRATRGGALREQR